MTTLAKQKNKYEEYKNMKERQMQKEINKQGKKKGWQKSREKRRKNGIEI